MASCQYAVSLRSAQRLVRCANVAESVLRGPEDSTWHFHRLKGGAPAKFPIFMHHGGFGRAIVREVRAVVGYGAFRIWGLGCFEGWCICVSSDDWSERAKVRGELR